MAAQACMADRLITSSTRYEDPPRGGQNSAPKAERPERLEESKPSRKADPSLSSRDEERAHLVSEDETLPTLTPRSPCPAFVVPVAATVLFIGFVASAVMSLIALLRPTPPPARTPTCHASPTPAPPLPAGTNFGGWLVLEDWFFSGQEGRYVTSADTAGQGVCLPPQARGTVDRWPSEGVLVQQLNSSVGPRKTLDVITSHRHSYIGESDLALLAELGIRKVRVPITWAAFADALAPLSPGVYGAHNASRDAVIVPDPFHSGKAALVTVPRAWLAEFLRRAAGHGVRVVLDLHSMPGGSSDGTYNGVWPHTPAFWTATAKVGGATVALTTAGLWVVAALIDWIESLDEEARIAVDGITVMNEPAHMAASLGFAQEEVVLRWLESAAELFRQSSLPDRGVKMYVNMIETAFADFWGVVGPWWEKTFSEAERHTWAVFDQHWYTAWDGGRCDGRVLPGGGYLCDEPLDKVRELLRSCAKGFTQLLTSHIQGLKSCSEFSAGTFADAVVACNDRKLLRAFLEEQIAVFKEDDVEPFFWTWRMPYGPSFEMGWSLKKLLGHEDTPTQHPCSLSLGVM